MLNGHTEWQIEETSDVDMLEYLDTYQKHLDVSTMLPICEFVEETTWSFEENVFAQLSFAPMGPQETVSYYETMLDKQQQYYDNELQVQMNQYEEQLQQQTSQYNEQLWHIQQLQSSHQCELQALEMKYVDKIEGLEEQLEDQQAYYEQELLAQDVQLYSQEDVYQRQLQAHQMMLNEQQGYYEARLSHQLNGYECQLDDMQSYYETELSQAQDIIESQQQAWEEEQNYFISTLQEMYQTIEFQQTHLQACEPHINRLTNQLSAAKRRVDYLERDNDSARDQLFELERVYKDKCDDFISTRQEHQVALLRKNDQIRDLENQQQMVLFHFEQQANQKEADSTAFNAPVASSAPSVSVTGMSNSSSYERATSTHRSQARTLSPARAQNKQDRAPQNVPENHQIKKQNRGCSIM